MPEELPFEDVWFSLVIKLNAKKILHIKRPMYLYRQHDNQTFGGILNYSKDALNFRAKRLLDLISELEKHPEEINYGSIKVFDYIKSYYELLQNEFNIFSIIKSRLRLLHKFKLVLLCFIPKLAKQATLLKWKLHRLK